MLSTNYKGALFEAQAAKKQQDRTNGAARKGREYCECELGEIFWCDCAGDAECDVLTWR
jgi:hypothetical protein